MMHDPDFIPGRSDKILQCWAGKGLVTFSQLFEKDIISAFNEVADRYDLEQKHFFKYLQIRS